MSEYENVVVEKLRLKGKALGVKGDGIRKKKKQKQKQKKRIDEFSQLLREEDRDLSGRNVTSLVDCSKETVRDTDGRGGGKGLCDDMLTAAERRYLRQWEKIDLQRMAKMASKSHRDRIQEFNQHLANLSEHHDIPKVGPG